MTTDIPWAIRRVTHGGPAEIHIEGFNRYDGELFRWCIDHFSFGDPKHVARCYTFRGATWGQGAREAFKQIIARAKATRAFVRRRIESI